MCWIVIFFHFSTHKHWKAYIFKIQANACWQCYTLAEPPLQTICKRALSFWKLLSFSYSNTLCPKHSPPDVIIPITFDWFFLSILVVHISKMIKYLFLCFWSILFIMVLLRFICVVVSIGSLPFFSWIIFHYMIISDYVHPFFCWWTFG